MDDNKKYINIALRVMRHIYVAVALLIAISIVKFDISSNYNVEAIAIRLPAILKSANSWGILGLGPILAAIAAFNQDMETGMLQTKLSVSPNKKSYITKKIFVIYLWTGMYTLFSNIFIIFWTKQVFHWFLSEKERSLFFIALLAMISTELCFVSLFVYINFFIKTSLYGVVSVVFSYAIGHVLIFILTKAHLTKIFTFILFPFLYSAGSNYTFSNMLIQLMLSTVITVILYVMIIWTFVKRDWNIRR